MRATIYLRVRVQRLYFLLGLVPCTIRECVDSVGVILQCTEQCPGQTSYAVVAVEALSLHEALPGKDLSNG